MPGPEEFTRLIGAAVTPVVMISACAVLIMGIGTKHAGIGDRIRALAAEYRNTPEDSPRRPVLRRQLEAFLRRATFSWVAHMLLYVATLAFTGTVITGLAALEGPRWGVLTIGLFVLGTALLIAALVLELCELLLAQATLRIEVDETVG